MRHHRPALQPRSQTPHFSLDWVKQSLAQLGETDFVHEVPNAEIYSWDLVVRRSANPKS